ncbi:MAG: hypothetical protein FWG13_07655 [Leptospirales bacterium]|nr:hypothetical protein [Leptospirales bacterium]
MSKRLFTLLSSLVLISSVTTVSFTQDNGNSAGTGGDSSISAVSTVDEPDSLRHSAPKPVIYFDGYNTYINTRVAYKLSAKDDVQAHKLYYKIDNGTEREYKAPFSFETEGRHTVTYRSSDRMERRGNENTFTVILDDSPPVIVLLSETPVIKSGDIAYLAPDTVFTIKASDQYSGVASLQYSVNGEEMKDYETSFSLPEESKELDIKITSTDNVGISTNKYTIKAKDVNDKEVVLSSEGLMLVRDTTPPEVTITADKEIFQNEKELNVVGKDYKYTITATDEESGVATVLYRISGDKDFQKYTQPFALKNTGINKIEAKAIDKVGNVSTPVILTVFVDVIPPTTLIKPLVDENEYCEY